MPPHRRSGDGTGAAEGYFGLPLADLDAVVERSSADLVALSGASVLVTGGTGFLGSWIVASLLRANETLGLGQRLVVLSRSPELVPLEQGPGLELVRGDVRILPEIGSVDLVVHGAASSAVRFGEGDGEPRALTATIVDGTRAVLELAARSGARLLFLSSGAVYGRQQAPVGEDEHGGPDPLDPRSAYGEAKRLAETLCAVAALAGELEAVVARLFAFVGPRIPLEAHFAAGNFIADALARRPIEVEGDGTAQRSYLYSGDLPQWCAALLARGASGRAYNVGSPEQLSIAELATRVAALVDPPLPVVVRGAQQPQPLSCYVPSVARAASELGLRPEVGLDEALAKTHHWCTAHH
ncbi:MAG TPA: NAD-dependent epimerase/dehydratase family protein [Acidimicrobiales bacterium]|nr:NAD-dependent epimerase/dehydratase family protein [Acidimicrobiales bacterium]